MKKKYAVIGIDFGGTNIKFGLISPDRKIVSRKVIKTAAFAGKRSKLIKAMADMTLLMVKESSFTKKEVKGIGIGLPGLIDPQQGLVKLLPNVDGWRNVRLVKELSKLTHFPVVIDNDVNMIAFGEWQFGAGKGRDNLVCLTLGTGVGGALIFNGQMIRGEDNVAGEIGHMLIRESGKNALFGDYGYLEHYMGNRQLREKAVKLFNKPDIQLPEIDELAKKGNRKAIKMWEEVAELLGNNLVNIINLLNPKLVIIGGGVSNNLQLMLPKINEVIQERCMEVHRKTVKVVRAKLGNDAGIFGAYYLLNHGSF